MYILCSFFGLISLIQSDLGHNPQQNNKNESFSNNLGKFAKKCNCTIWPALFGLNYSHQVWVYIKTFKQIPINFKITSLSYRTYYASKWFQITFNHGRCILKITIMCECSFFVVLGTLRKILYIIFLTKWDLILFNNITSHGKSSKSVHYPRACWGSYHLFFVPIVH